MKNALPPWGCLKILLIDVNAPVLLYAGKPLLPIPDFLLYITDSLLPIFVEVQTKAALRTGLKPNYYFTVESSVPSIWLAWLLIRAKILFSM